MKNATKYLEAGAKGAVKVGAGIVAQQAGGELLRAVGGATVSNFEAQQPDIMPVLVNIAGGGGLVAGAAFVAKKMKKPMKPGTIGLAVTGVMAGALLRSAKVTELMDRAAGAIVGLAPGGLSGYVAPAGIGSYGAPAQYIPGGLSAEVAASNTFPGGMAKML